MKFTLSWLKDHLETEATLDEILYALTDLGLEVEEVEQAVGWASAHHPPKWRAEARPTQTGTIR